MRGLQQLGVAREPEVVVGAEVQHRLGAALDADLGALRAEDRPLLLEQALLADRRKLARKEAPEARVHGPESSMVVSRLMAASAFDSFYLRDRYGTPEMRAIWDDRATIQRWLDVEAALAQVEAELGLVPRAAARAIARAAKVERIDLARDAPRVRPHLEPRHAARQRAPRPAAGLGGRLRPLGRDEQERHRHRHGAADQGELRRRPAPARRRRARARAASPPATATR